MAACLLASHRHQRLQAACIDDPSAGHHDFRAVTAARDLFKSGKRPGVVQSASGWLTMRPIAARESAVTVGVGAECAREGKAPREAEDLDHY